MVCYNWKLLEAVFSIFRDIQSKNQKSSNLHWKNDSYTWVSAPNHQFFAPRLFQHKQSYVDHVQALGQKFDSLFSQLVEENKEIKSQLSKLTNSMSINEKEKFLAKDQANPKGVNLTESEFEHAKSMIALRSGK